MCDLIRTTLQEVKSLSKHDWSLGLLLSEMPCNKKWSEQSERDFTAEKDIGKSVRFYVKPIEVISFKPIKVVL